MSLKRGPTGGSPPEGMISAMEIELSDLLSSFESAAERLNDTSDSVNSILGAIEKRLIAANVGLESWLRSPLTQSDATGSTGGETSWIDQRLGFAKVGGKWCLAVKPICHVSGFFEGDTN